MNIKIFLRRVFSFRNAKTVALSLAGVAVFLFAVGYGLSWYGKYSFNKDLQAIKKEAERPYLEDIYGGKTPKETLELFIAAIEKEDFDLASKYFVINKQEEWRDRLVKGEKQKLYNWIDLLKTAQDRGSLWDGNFQMEVKNAAESANLIIDFIKYPQGIWKIQEM